MPVPLKQNIMLNGLSLYFTNLLATVVDTDPSDIEKRYKRISNALDIAAPGLAVLFEHGMHQGPPLAHRMMEFLNFYRRLFVDPILVERQSRELALQWFQKGFLSAVFVIPVSAAHLGMVVVLLSRYMDVCRQRNGTEGKPR